MEVDTFAVKWLVQRFLVIALHPWNHRDKPEIMMNLGVDVGDS